MFSPTQNNKYYPIKGSESLKAYVVNVYDPINFDLDILWSNTELKEIYGQSIQNEYKYKIVTEDFIVTEEEKIGTSHRCHLKGVASKHPYNKSTACASIDIKRMIDGNDGWATCIVSDIDIYKRILIELFVAPRKSIAEFLLTKYPDDYENYDFLLNPPKSTSTGRVSFFH